MTNRETAIATFFTTSAAFMAEKALKENDIPARLVPAPRALSADCTIALAFSPSQLQRVREILAARGIEASGLHPGTL